MTIKPFSATRFLALFLALGTVFTDPLAGSDPAGLADSVKPIRKSESSASSDDSRPPILPVDQVVRGQRGYGLSVFAGTEPVRFEVEVLGVWHKTTAGVDYVIARLSGQDLETSGVIAGMSGSPVYIDERLVGAVAFSWSFTNEAIAGITPIAAMRTLGELPAGPPDGTAAVRGPEVEFAWLASRNPPADFAEKALRTLMPRSTAPTSEARPAVDWATVGFGESSRAFLATALGSVNPAGRMLDGGALTAGDDLALGNGSPVAAMLVDGDLRLAAHGTITERFGNEILAFGHPFLGGGPSRIPMATGEVITILSSKASSFKVSNLGESIGAFEQDALVGVRGVIGAEAPTLPMTVRIGGVRERVYEMQMAAVPAFLAGLTGAAVFGCLDTTSFSSGPQGIDLKARFGLDGYDDLVIDQTFDGPDAAVDSVRYLMAVAGYLASNGLAKVGVESIEVDLNQHLEPRSATLLSAHAERSVVRPGERVNLSLELKAYRGERFRESIEVLIPEDLPAGRLSLLVGDGASADAARAAVQPTSPATIEQALDLMGSFLSPRQLVVLGVMPDAGLAVSGTPLPRLPGSIRSVWKAAASGEAKPLRLAIVQETVEERDAPFDGIVRVDLEVRRRRPVGAESAGAGTGAEAGSTDSNPADSASSETVSDGSDPSSAASSAASSDELSDRRAPNTVTTNRNRSDQPEYEEFP